MEREEQKAWELAKQLVQIDSSDPGAYEEEIGLWITDWFKKQITDFGGKLADQIHGKDPWKNRGTGTYLYLPYGYGYAG